MEEYYNVDIRRAGNTSALQSFYCGVKSMDDFIHDKDNGLAKFIDLGVSNLWLVYKSGSEKVIAFFALSKDALVLNSEDKRNIEGHPGKPDSLVSPDNWERFWDEEKYPAIELDYFAVCKELRDKKDIHLGSFLIDEICRMSHSDVLSATKFITVEALDTPEYSAVNFYKKCDFQFSEKARNQAMFNSSMTGERPTTQRMYKIILPEE